MSIFNFPLSFLKYFPPEVSHKISIQLLKFKPQFMKNKIIDSLNEKFKIITNSDTPFISIVKSPQDKRIQLLKIIKYNKKFLNIN